MTNQNLYINPCHTFLGEKNGKNLDKSDGTPVYIRR